MSETTTIDACSQLLRHLNMLRFPFAELRPKPLTPEECFRGDYDFLYDGERKEDLIREITFFLKNKGVSFVILRKNRLKLQVKIFDYESGRNIILEFWSASVISPSIGALNYSSALTWHDLKKFISPTEDHYGIHPNIRALIYITHLKAKKKNLKKPETAARLRYFREHCLPGGGGIRAADRDSQESR